jgi:hypothetical protein
MAVDRKALIRKYKETPKTAGIYRVRNLTNEKSLVGASPDVPSMLNRERAQLRTGTHMNRPLQADWIALGADAFAFEILDTLAPPADNPAWDPTDDLRELERMWLEKLSPFGDRGYNPESSLHR